MPSWELFLEQDESYRKEVIPENIPKVVVEAGVALGWKDIVGDNSIIIGLDRFGESAPGDVLMKEFGFTPENVAEKALSVLQKIA